MIVLNILSFGRYLLLKKLLEPNLACFAITLAIIICERITVLNLSLKTDYIITIIILHFISTGSRAFNDVFNINYC